MTKSQLRQQYRAQRRTLEIGRLSQSVCDRLGSWPKFQRAKQVLAYWPHDHELDLRPLIQAWPQKIWGLPRCLPQRRLGWHHYQVGEALWPGAHGLLEPPPHWPVLTPEPLTETLVLVPMVAGDRHGYRLGYGGGYYDRWLATLPPTWPILTAGIVPQVLLLADPLPRDDWDQPLGAILTEVETLDFSAPPQAYPPQTYLGDLSVD